LCSLTIYTFKGINLNTTPYNAMIMYLVGVYISIFCNIVYLFQKWEKYFNIKRQINDAIINGIHIEDLNIDYEIEESPILFRIRLFGLVFSFFSSIFVTSKVFPNNCGIYENHISCVPLVLFSWLFVLIYIILSFILIVYVIRCFFCLCTRNNISITQEEIDRLYESLYRYSNGRTDNLGVGNFRNIVYKYKNYTPNNDIICPICFETDTEIRNQETNNKNNNENKYEWIELYDCEHKYHKMCIKDWIKIETQNNKVAKCPVCRNDIKYIFKQQDIV